MQVELELKKEKLWNRFLNCVIASPTSKDGFFEAISSLTFRSSALQLWLFVIAKNSSRRCPACGASGSALLSGMEMEIVSVDVEEDGNS